MNKNKVKDSSNNLNYHNNKNKATSNNNKNALPDQRHGASSFNQGCRDGGKVLSCQSPGTSSATATAAITAGASTQQKKKTAEREPWRWNKSRENDIGMSLVWDHDSSTSIDFIIDI
jgi:hypothetical protein